MSFQEHTHADHRWTDQVGIWLSANCLVHCVLTPAALLLLPAVLVAHASRALHLSLAFLLPAVAVLAFVPGFKSHKNRGVIGMGLGGLALILLAAFLFEGRLFMDAGVTIAGSTLLILAHVRNRKLCRGCC